MVLRKTLVEVASKAKLAVPIKATMGKVTATQLSSILDILKVRMVPHVALLYSDG